MNEFTELETRGWLVGKCESLTGLRGREGRGVIQYGVRNQSVEIRGKGGG